jgi:GTP cyclohydrolase II
VRLMTNNPQKLSGLERAGVAIVAHEPHWMSSTEHNASYLAAKKAKLGHLG